MKVIERGSEKLNENEVVSKSENGEPDSATRGFRDMEEVDFSIINHWSEEAHCVNKPLKSWCKGR